MDENSAIIVGVLAVVGLLFLLALVADSSGRAHQEKLFAKIAYTEILAVYAKSSVYRVYYTDGTVKNIDCDYTHPDSVIYQAKCIGRG